MSGRTTQMIRDFLIAGGPATLERVAESIPELSEAGGAQRALLLMRLDPALERTENERWAARRAAITDQSRVRNAAEKFFGDRPGTPLTSAIRAVAKETALPQHQVRELLTSQFVVVGSNVYNRRR